MGADGWLVFGVLGVTVALFLTDRLRLDLVALLAVIALMVLRVLTPAEALAGFSDDLVLIIAGLFVVGGGLFRTGVAAVLGDRLSRVAGTGPVRLLVVLMVSVALLSAVMSSTGTVAIFLPVAVALARKAGIAPSKLLIPLAFSSLLGGMLTLIGTPPNIVVARELEARGLEPFGFFAFTPLGLVMLVIGVVFMAVLGRRMLPSRPSPFGGGADGSELSAEQLSAVYGLDTRLARLRLASGCGLAGRTLASADVRADYGVTVVDVVERPRPLRVHLDEEEVDPQRPLQVDDHLVVLGDSSSVDRLCDGMGLERVDTAGQGLLPRSSALAEVLLTPRSRLLGRSLRRSRFRQQYDLTVLSLRRFGKPVEGQLGEVPLRFGDTLLVQGSRDEMDALQREARDFVVIGGGDTLSSAGAGLTHRGALAASIMVAMLLLMATGAVPAVVAVLLAAAAMVLTRCLSMEGAYRSVSWESVVLVAAMLPMATALDKTGGMELVVDGIVAGLGSSGPIVVMAGLFLLTSLFSQFISNTATTVLVAPIAFETAVLMDVSPHTFLITVAIAASTAFATPIASPVNTLVLTPGGYKFTDYTKVGVGLQLLVMVATLLLAPLVFPLG
jgi:di/tricarboxylate transporter